MTLSCATVDLGGYIGTFPGYNSFGKCALVLKKYTCSCSTIPARLLCGSTSAIYVTVAFLVS